MALFFPSSPTPLLLPPALVNVYLPSQGYYNFSLYFSTFALFVLRFGAHGSKWWETMLKWNNVSILMTFLFPRTEFPLATGSRWRVRSHHFSEWKFIRKLEGKYCMSMHLHTVIKSSPCCVPITYILFLLCMK